MGSRFWGRKSKIRVVVGGRGCVPGLSPGLVDGHIVLPSVWVCVPFMRTVVA